MSELAKFAKDKKVNCYNKCKGKGDCSVKKGANKHDCAGKNGCAGQGKVEKMSKAECDAKEGMTSTKPTGPMMEEQPKAEEKKEGT